MIHTALSQLGFNEKEIDVYLACLKLGPSPVRKIAQEAKINRGTTYDILKKLINDGLVSYYHKSTRQYFIAEDPEKLREIVSRQHQKALEARGRIETIIPELKSMHDNAGNKPVVKFFEGYEGVKTILKDVLKICLHADPKTYFVYSTSVVSNVLYKLYPNFTKDRIRADIWVKVISIGPGGQTRGLDERKWLTHSESAPTYTIIYLHKVAMMTLDSEGRPLGVLVEDKNIYQTQRMIFEFVWGKIV